MRPFLHSNWLESTGRISAVLAMIVMFAGQAVHLGQECGGCLSGSCCSDTSAKPKHSLSTSGKFRFSKCPAGCTHHATGSTKASDEGTPPPNDDRSPHDEHNCPVCSQLAQAPSCSVLTELPKQVELVWETISLSCVVPVAAPFLTSQSRGPPESA